jgi:enoyl-[acyl-carrier protein] reductase I
MGFLQGKRILVTGMLSNRSIAYGVAKAVVREGAEVAFTYQGEGIRERVAGLAAEFGGAPLFPCDVADDAQIDALFAGLAAHWPEGFDGLLHAIAFAPREALKGEFHESVTREAFRIAHDISSYSLAALAKGAAPLMQARGGGSIVTLTYLGAVRSIPRYNVMGLAKASLEAGVRYLAAGLGPQGIRVNAISAGPIKTLAAAGIGDFGKIFRFVEKNAPLRRNVTTEEVGNVAAFYLSSLSSGITGEVTYVDSGFSTTTAGLAGED